MSKPGLPPSLVFSGLAAALLLTACGPDPDTAPSTGDEVKDRAIEAQTARKRTGAEIQDRTLNRVVHTVYLCDNGERLSVDFDNPRQMATIRNSSGEAVDLYQERAADGIWYRASNVELRGKGSSLPGPSRGANRPNAGRWIRRTPPAFDPARPAPPASRRRSPRTPPCPAHGRSR
ncbi:MliC family protein [uncultured Brevundimonas sp.]|uniref:MliC family protein n=1 Tax=uncultured Brevundimonas sp. TaxID=213418 RepID=UPI00260CAEF4|nr:MliC family protein [uncultured Brevundimonas sp.]